ncbi:MAG: hypothetical protein ABEI13_03425 [Candidatus Paceibacteria bacterium]
MSRPNWRKIAITIVLSSASALLSRFLTELTWIQSLIFTSTTTIAVVILLFLFPVLSPYIFELALTSRLTAAWRALQGDLPDPRLQKLGVEKGVESTKDGPFSVKEATDRAEESIKFLGLFGSKWVDENYSRNQFTDLLDEFEANHGSSDCPSVKFMLVDTSSHGFEEIASMRNVHNSTLSKNGCLKQYHELEEKYDCLSIKLYSFIPTFRLIFVDERLGISRYHYKPPEELKDFKRGREIPHVAVNPEPRYTLRDPFEQLFDQLWRSDETERLKPKHYNKEV